MTSHSNLYNDTGKLPAFDQLRLTLSQTDPPNALRLVCKKKLKGEDIPTTDDLIPIAITALMQKLIEKTIISKITIQNTRSMPLNGISVKSTSK